MRVVLQNFFQKEFVVVERPLIVGIELLFFNKLPDCFCVRVVPAFVGRAVFIGVCLEQFIGWIGQYYIETLCDTKKFAGVDLLYMVLSDGEEYIARVCIFAGNNNGYSISVLNIEWQ